jgi:hypothetical protein
MASNVRFLDQVSVSSFQGSGEGGVLDIFSNGSLFKSNVTQINFSGSIVTLESFNDNNVTVFIQDTGGNFVVENAANYRLITANNNAETGSAQSNLTFDGSTLRVTGSLETTGAIISDGINVIDNAIAMAIALG